jgi:tetratricopeptide (TPR) repeat protein
MKQIGIASLLLFSLSACHHSPNAIVNTAFTDSLMVNYRPSLAITANADNLAFWKKRMDSLPDNFVNGPEYASALVARFRLSGDIHDLLKADSLYTLSNDANQGKEPGIFRTLAGLSLLRHQFKRADSNLLKAIQIDGINHVPNIFLDFDIAFETGRFGYAKKLLRSLDKTNPYGFLFRRSKFEHYDGSLDTAIACMERAAAQAGDNKYLRQVALSNAADLHIHKGDLQQAYRLYSESLLIDAADLHSLTGIGWLALVNDKNDSLAERIFLFVHNHSHSPDVLLKLVQVAEVRGDSIMQTKYAEEFASIVNDPTYGGMYTKYLIDLYTGILHNPAKAVILSRNEIENRPTAQVYAWYAWSLLCNGQSAEAYDVFKHHVSGQPLEGPELYYMGKLMQVLDKGYNAQQFFKAAAKNRYDLSVARQKELTLAKF